MKTIPISTDTLVPLRIKAADIPMRLKVKEVGEDGIRKNGCGV